MKDLAGFFFHNIENPPLFVQKLLGQNDVNMNVTWVFTNDPQNIVLPASRQLDRYNGLAASFSEDSPFYAGFIRNVGSSGFFQIGEVVSNMPHKLYLSALLRKGSPHLAHSIFWPKFSVSSFKQKLTETSFQARQDKSHSDTNYSGQYVKSSNISFGPNNFQLHNEAHLKPPISDLKSIIIEKSKIDPDSKLIISALKLQHKIKSERHKILTDTDEISKKNLEHCIDTEILKTKIAYQKIALLLFRLKSNELRTLPTTNSEIHSSFASKNIKGFITQGEVPQKLITNQPNIKIWTDTHKIKFQSEIQNIQRENSIEDQTIENFKTRFEGATHENLDEIYRNLQEDIENIIKKMMVEQAIRDKAKKSVMKKLEREVPIEIYDESSQDLIKKVDILDLILEKDSSMKIISGLASLEDLSVFIDIGLDFLKLKPDKSKFFSDCFNELTSESKYRILKHALESKRPDFIDALQPDKLQLFNEVLAPALEKKDANLIRFLLENPGLKYDFQAGNGLTMLHLFVEKGDIESVKILLARGANFNLTDSNGLTPLDIAIEKCEIDMIQEILEDDKSIDLHQKLVALNILIDVNYSNLDMLNMSIGYIANEQPHLSNTATKILNKALSLALENYQICDNLGIDSDMKKITETLLKNASTKTSQNLIFLIAEMGDLKLAEIILKKDLDLSLKNSDNQTPLDIAIQNNRVEMALELSKKQGMHPRQLLDFAISTKKIDFFKILLKKIIETESDHNSIKDLGSTFFKIGFEKKIQH